MNKKIEKIKKSELFRVSSLNTFGVFIKFVTGLISSKCVAILIGPSGIALVGNFRNFAASIESLSTLGFQNGIVKYVADNKEDQNNIKSLFATLLSVLVIVSIPIGLGLFFFSDYWNSLIFGDTYPFELVFKVMAVLLPCSIYGIYLVAIINGFNQYKQVIIITIIANFVSLLLTIGLVYYFSTIGAILSVLFSSTMLFFLAYIYFPQKKYFFTSPKLNADILKHMSHYLIMIVVSGVLGQALQIYIRNLIIAESDMDQAGYWEAMNRISSNYMLFINTLLSVYYYPKLINANNNLETKKVFREYYKNIVPLFVIGAFIIFLFKDYVIKLLFSAQFESVSTLFFWQLLGDFFKTISLILGFQFLAKKMTKEFLIFEIVSFTTLFLASVYFIPIYKTQGAVIAFALCYFVYWAILSVFFRKKIF